MTLLLELVANFGVSSTDIARIIQTAPARYKVFEIPKRTGGTRTIAHPSRELKAIQRYVLQEKLVRFPVHEAAAAYVTGRGISSNAQAHRDSETILKLDFRSFFPSIKTRDWELLLKAHAPDFIDASDFKLYSKILFWGETPKSISPVCLSIGAPTSPILSNILMFELDCLLSQAALERGVIYTRYADDITASSNDLDAIKDFEKTARKIIRTTRSPKLSFNEDKRGLYKKGQRRMVTGLIITPRGEVSVGRARKREISALMHRSALGQLDFERRGYLKGMLGFCISVEPQFVSKLRTKYGDEIVDAALSFRVPPRAEG